MWVHLAGFVSQEYEEILDLAKEKKLFVIEDSAHALGAVVDGKRAGSLGDAGCFSFYPTKVITCGTGGMIATANKELKAYAERMRVFGKAPGTEAITELGNDWFLDEIRACIGYNQLLDLASNLKVRRKIADQYRTLLEGQPGITMIAVSEKAIPNYYQFPVLLDRGMDRQTLIRALKENHGIETKGIYRPCHKEQVFTQYDDGSLRNTEETLERSLCLPLFVNMSGEDVEYVAACLVKEVRAAL
jgi:perosamine synthetase